MLRLALLFILLICACTPTATPPPQIAAVPSRLLDPWQVYEDTLTTADPARAWQFAAQEGDAVRLTIATKTGGRAQLSLHDADGDLLAQGDDITVTLPAAGTHSAQVRLIEGESAVYRLSLTYADRPTPTVPTRTPTPTETYPPTLTPTSTFTPSHTPTPSPTFTPSHTPTPSDTPTPSHTPTPLYAALGTFISQITTGVSEGQFLSGFERHIYTFEGLAGRYVTIHMRHIDTGVDPVITLYDPAANPVAMDDDTGEERSALLQNIRQPADGTYFIQALGGTGRYILLMESHDNARLRTPIPPAPTPTLAVGMPTALPAPADGSRLSERVPMRGNIAPDSFDRYFISAESGDVLTIGVRPAAGSALQPRVEVVSPAGEIIFAVNVRESNAGGDALVPVLNIVEAGTYTVYVTDEGAAGGDYTISYGRGASHTDMRRGAALPDMLINGNVERRGLRDVWSIYLHAGDAIQVDVLPDNPRFNATVEIAAEDGTIIGADEAGADGLSIRDARAHVTGWYEVRISGANAGTFGTYAFNFGYVTTGATATPQPATIALLTASDSLPPQTYRYYPFQGEAGRAVRVTVRGIDGVDPVAALVAPDGTIAAESDDAIGLDPLMVLTLPQAGTYQVRVSSYGSAGGSVEVTVEELY